jgi:hypothetical protein
MANRIGIFQLTLVFAVLNIFIGCIKNDEQKPDIQYFKLDGLNRLFQPSSSGSGTAYIHTALAKDGQTVVANDCGIGSLEDLAGAARLYLRCGEINGDTSSYRQAQQLLHTVLWLQKTDGRFFNWINANGQPALCNDDGVNGLGYPEVRALWALAAGVKNFEQRDRVFAQKLHEAFWRSFVHVDSCLRHYGKFYEKDGRRFPQWLPFRSGADAASVLILAFDAISRSSLNDTQQTQRLEQAMQHFAEGIQKMQAGAAGELPFGAHLAFETYWHGWGNFAMQALAIAGEKFKRQDFIESAMLEADHFVPYLLENQFAHRFNLVDTQKNPNRIDYFPQTAADIRPSIAGLLELSRVTGNRRYARRAGEMARWFRGENKAHEAIYIEKLGLARDFIQGHNHVTPEFSAAATVEALLAILAVEKNSDARSEFYVKIENVLEGKP